MAMMVRVITISMSVKAAVRRGRALGVRCFMEERLNKNLNVLNRRK
jgi:hypothetical protein